MLIIALAIARSKFLKQSSRDFYAMGTPITIKLYDKTDDPSLLTFAVAEIKKLDKAFSHFNYDSEVSKINRLAGKSGVKVSDDMFRCVYSAKKIHRISNGAFDITLGSPWSLAINESRQRIFLRASGTEINLGGIAKGYAAHRVRQLLLKNGVKSGMIDMRSTMAFWGPKTWRIGVQHPREKNKLLGVVELTGGQSLATSGDYERGQHIIDPRTGKPADQCQGVTLIGQNAAELDALSTAVFVLGTMEGMELIGFLPEVEGVIVGVSGEVYKSSGWVWADTPQ